MPVSEQFDFECDLCGKRQLVKKKRSAESSLPYAWSHWSWLKFFCDECVRTIGKNCNPEVNNGDG